jgi:hypothetical protein
MERKYLWSLMSLLLWANTSSAQTELPPKEEYKLLTSHSTIFLARGQQDSVKLTVLRSRSFKTGKASISLNTPSTTGLRVTLKQQPTNPDEYTVYLTASPDAQTGEFNFIPTCTLRNKNKGIILKLIIN